MVKDINFEATINKPFTLGSDLSMPADAEFEFSVSGKADKKFLKSLQGIIKRHSKAITNEKK